MFPSVRVKVKGLEPLQQYYIAIDVVPVDSKRYRYGGDRPGPPNPRGAPVLAASCDPPAPSGTRGSHGGAGGPARTYRIYRVWGQVGMGSRRLTEPGPGQVRLSQLAVDGGGEHGPLLHHPAPLHPPRLPLLGGDLDEANHQLRPREAHQQRDGRQGARRCGAAPPGAAGRGRASPRGAEHHRGQRRRGGDRSLLPRARGWVLPQPRLGFSSCPSPSGGAQPPVPPHRSSCSPCTSTSLASTLSPRILASI